MKEHSLSFILVFSILVMTVLISGCVQDTDKDAVVPTRESSIPSDAIKIKPADDVYPPILHSTEYEEPIPLSSMVNTAGAEDSPFIDQERNELYIFFTPDVSNPPEKQILDGVTGIYMSRNIGSEWSKAERIMLQDPGKLALDGCAFVQGDVMWFCSAREGYTGINWFTASYANGKWTDWKNTIFNPEYEVGELHINGNRLYYHSPRSGGKGGFDIWVSVKKNEEWQSPENIAAINSGDNDGWPYVSKDGKELWFTRTYKGSPAIFRSKNVNGEWQDPELVISQFAGEPTFDSQGNLYFTHHFYRDGKMIEADIYMARKK